MSALLNILFGYLNSSAGLAFIQENLPKLLAFVSTLNTSVAEAKAKGLGHDEAMAVVTKQIAEVVRKAAEAAAQAEADHLAHPDDDSAFDQGVFRKEP
jgi:hypothetical protein